MSQTVFNNGQLAHVWAQRNQEHGRNAGDSFYFYGDVIYSYGSHFPIAKFITDDIVLYNSASYSPTTGKHQSNVRNAIPGGYQVFEVPNVDLRVVKRSEAKHIRERYMDMHRANLEYLKEQVEYYLIKAERARSSDMINWHMRTSIHLKDQHNAYLRAFKIKRKDYELPNADDLMSKAKGAEERERKAQLRRDAKLRKQYAEAVVDWRAGTIDRMSWEASGVFDTMLRVKPTDSDVVETSRRAEFPVKHAIKAYRIIKLCRRDSKFWKKNGHSIHLGHFQLDTIDASGNIKAGCHTVRWAEIEKMGEYLIGRNAEEVS